MDIIHTAAFYALLGVLKEGRKEFNVLVETYELKLSSIAKWQIYGCEFAQEHGLFSIGTSS